MESVERSFEIRRDEYLQKLRENPQLVESIVNNPNNSRKVLNIFLMPKSDIELIIANSLFTFFEDIINLIKHSYENDIKVDYDNNIYIELIVSIITALKNGNVELAKEISNKFNNERNPVILAKLIYDFFSIFSCDPDRAIDIIREKSGFVTEECDNREFKLYLYQSKALTNGAPQLKLDEVENLENNELVKISLDIIEQFHIICEKEKGLILSSK